MSTTEESEKETLAVHISILEDMLPNYPDAQRPFHEILVHLRGMMFNCRVRPKNGQKSITDGIASNERATIHGHGTE